MFLAFFGGALVGPDRNNGRRCNRRVFREEVEARRFQIAFIRRIYTARLVVVRAIREASYNREEVFQLTEWDIYI